MLGSWGRGGLAIVEMGTGNRGLGRETKRGKGKGKGPRRLGMQEQTQGKLGGVLYLEGTLRRTARKSESWNMGWDPIRGP